MKPNQNTPYSWIVYSVAVNRFVYLSSLEEKGCPVSGFFGKFRVCIKCKKKLELIRHSYIAPFELFDLGNIRTEKFIFESWRAGEVAIAPPMRPFQEEKLSLALFHHHRLQDYWSEALSGPSLKLLRALIPPSWVIDPAPLPPGAVLDGPRVGGRSLNDWRDLVGASQKERDLIIKISGYHETAWGARSVVLGSDCSREEWQAGVAHAIALAPTNLHVLQAFKKPRRLEHPLFDPRAAVGSAPVAAAIKPGRLRLCPYYFVIGGRAELSGALATFCPPDKKIIHGMTDAALLPCCIVPA